MKRTRETLNYSHPDAVRGARTGLSGAFYFDGEDPGHDERVKNDRAMQKAALEQQMEEKKQAQRVAREQDM